jgi:glycosyltransferase 2 family protein
MPGTRFASLPALRMRGLGRAALGIAISIVAVAVVVRSVDLGAAWAVLRSARPAWIVLLVAFVAIDVLLRAVRWRVLLAPLAQVQLRATLASLLVGYLANNVLPARLGEVVRSHDLGQRTGVSRAAVLGTIVVERVVDTLVVVSIASLAILVLSVRGVVASAVLVGLAVSALLVVGVAAGIAAHRLPGAARVGGFLDRWPQVRDVLTRLREGLTVAADLRTLLLSVALTFGSWSSTVLAFAAAAQAVGFEPTMGQAALLAAGTNLATAVPAAPGYVGTFELAAVTIAASVGIDGETALAFAVLVHATSLLLTSIGGATALVLGGRQAHDSPEGLPPDRRAAPAVTDPGRTPGSSG